VTADVSSVSGLRRSPLGHRADLVALSGPAVSLAEVPFQRMIDLRVAPGSAVAQRVSRALGVTLPGPGAVASRGAVSVLRLGPDEWLVVAPDGVELVTALDHAVRPDPGGVVDVSAHRTTVALRGPAARAVLSHGCALDLDRFGPRRCASTLLGPVDVILWRVQDDEYRLLVRCSYAEYLADWLLDAGLEYRH
jgi:sarcosine oxidase subunit gamma